MASRLFSAASLADARFARRSSLRHSFEEFKGLYNAAIDDTQGKKRKDARSGPAKTSSGLDNSVLAQRKEIAQQKALKKAEEAERIRKQNAEMKARIMQQGKGKDPKALDEEVEAKRLEMAKARQAAKVRTARQRRPHFTAPCDRAARDARRTLRRRFTTTGD